MFGKPKDENDHLQRPAAIQSGEQVLTENDHLQRPAAVQSEGRVSTDQASFISRGMTVVGKIVGEGTVEIFGGIEGELRALTVLINEGAKVEGDIIAEELTISGQVKGPSTQTASSSIAPPWSRGIFFIDRYRSRKMHALKDRQNGKTRLSMCRDPR